MSRLTEHEISAHHREVKDAAAAARGDEKKLKDSRDRTMDRAERREYSQRKFKIGGERRWRETY